ncbi:MAG TPA: metal-dependent transcriptional regulator [Solirubrobacteraceae bacterium]|nr:metal-dependent transcriptional regulator [Solirubrobacteraceae bacterium]
MATDRPPAAETSEAIEDYLKAIRRTARGPRRIASTTGVAQFHGVAPASASSMFRRLAELGLVRYVPYCGVTLTTAGERLAARLARRHRLLETLLVEQLGMAWERAHVEADRLEHHVSAQLEEAIAAALGQPPDPEGGSLAATAAPVYEDTLALMDLDAGQAGEIAAVPEEPRMLRYLADRVCVQQGTRFVVREKQPFGGPLILRVGSRTVVLGGGLAASVRAKLIPADGTP